LSNNIFKLIITEKTFAEPEIGNFDNPVVKEDVRGLEVTMENIFSDQCFESIEDLGEDFHCFCFIEELPFLNKVFQCFAFIITK
jgi:hypothetical protein